MLWRHRAAGDQWRAAGSPRSGSADQYRICCLVFFLWIWSLVFRSLPRHHRRNAAAVAKSAAPQSYRYTSFRFPPRHRNKKRCRCRSAVPSLRGRGAEPPCARSQNNRSKSNCHPQAFRAGPQQQRFLNGVAVLLEQLHLLPRMIEGLQRAHSGYRRGRRRVA